MDLAPFARINPCGYKGMQITQVKNLGLDLTVDAVAQQWLPYFTGRLGCSSGKTPMPAVAGDG
jgi:lipoyl(octanoyl) transferase